MYVLSIGITSEKLRYSVSREFSGNVDNVGAVTGRKLKLSNFLSQKNYYFVHNVDCIVSVDFSKLSTIEIRFTIFSVVGLLVWMKYFWIRASVTVFREIFEQLRPDNRSDHVRRLPKLHPFRGDWKNQRVIFFNRI